MLSEKLSSPAFCKESLLSGRYGGPRERRLRESTIYIVRSWKRAILQPDFMLSRGVRLESPDAIQTSAQVRTTLRNILSLHGGITKPSDWVTKVTVQPLYQTSRQLAKLVLLAAHKDRIGDQINPGLIKRGVAGTFSSLSPAVWRAHYSVEHIAPQTLATGDTSYEQAIYDQGLVDRLGNLTLMPEDLNSMLSNKTWPFKRDVYAVLSMNDPDVRLTDMQKRLPGLAATTSDLLRWRADYLPVCEFLPNQGHAALPASFLVKRGQRLAELAVERLWLMLA